MLWVLLTLIAMDLASNAVSVPGWTYIILIIVVAIIVAIEVASD
jgi:hypothetical protein